MQLEAAIPHLVQALRGDPNAMVRHEAAEALGAIASPAVVPHLEHFRTADAASEVRESCELALVHLAYLRDPSQF
jgi:deoxyhypusine monooxygenase